MFGQNEVTSPFPKADGSLLVTEVWRTIQGEGPDAGTPAIFVRLSKCNLRCYFCDTEFDKGEWYSVGDLLVKVFKLAVAKIRLVVLTGGEPLLQNINPFVSGCNAHGIGVSVETAGTTVQPGLEYFFGPKAHIKNLIVCSPKTPKLNEELIPLIGAFKYIVSPTTVDLAGDGLPSASTQLQDKPDRIYRPSKDSTIPIYVQPLDEQDQTINEINARFAAGLAIEHGYRLSLQQHKIVGLP